MRLWQMRSKCTSNLLVFALCTFLVFHQNVLNHIYLSYLSLLVSLCSLFGHLGRYKRWRRSCRSFSCFIFQPQPFISSSITQIILILPSADPLLLSSSLVQGEGSMLVPPEASQALSVRPGGQRWWWGPAHDSWIMDLILVLADLDLERTHPWPLWWSGEEKWWKCFPLQNNPPTVTREPLPNAISGTRW